MNRSLALLVCGVLSVPCLSQTETAQIKTATPELPGPRRDRGDTQLLHPGGSGRCRQISGSGRAPDRKASHEDLDELRNSDEYRQAYDSVADFTAKVDEHNAKRVCSESVNQRK